MQFPESWLREFCNPALSTEQLAETLTMAGLEVEELKPVAPPFTNIVVGEIKSVEQHPNADRLRICQVDVGALALLTIVCGAPNARSGIKIPCAMVGSQLPPGEDGKPFLIKLGKLRGVDSEGMLCSARELKLSEDHGGLLELSTDAVLGQNIREHLHLDDTLFTLKLTPNLAHCLSVYGVARELSALTNSVLKARVFPKISATDTSCLPVRISGANLCGRFSGRVFRNLDTKAATPAWMVERLARCGQRSVTALVDISNYVMFESGQPTHIFDLDKIDGSLDIRWAKSGETLKLLNGNTVIVDEKVGVISDDSRIESLAGIMGGDASAVSDETRNIYLEAAFWWPKAIAGRSRRYNFSTDAGHRFERGVDPGHTVDCIERVTQLILEICGTAETVVGPVDDLQGSMPASVPVAMRVARANKVIGMELTQAQCLQALSRLGLEVMEADGVLTVTPPSHRFDLQIEEDLIEEVVRIVGYGNLPSTPPRAPITARKHPETLRSTFAVRRALASLGYQETINFSFVEERWEQELAGNLNPIKLLNPIASQMSVMRSSLLGSLLQVLKFNLDRKATRVHVFELGRVFSRDAHARGTDTTVAGFHQPMRVAGLAYGPRAALHWGQPDKAVDFYDMKGDIEAFIAPLHAVFTPAMHPALHPGRCASVAIEGKVIGFIGELHPRWVQTNNLAQAPFLFELELENVLQRGIPVFEAISKFQPVERDVAVIVRESTTHAALMAAIESTDTGGLLRSAALFDIYRAPLSSTSFGSMAVGEKSLAVRLVFSSSSSTLTDQVVDSAVQAVLAQLQSRIGARLRT